MPNLQTRTVRELALEIPNATRVFEKLGIDYCCGGNRSLDAACDVAGVAVADVLHSLETVRQSDAASAADKKWQTEPLAKLTSYIVNKHHIFTADEVQRLEKLLTKVCLVHGDNHPELLKINRLFAELRGDLLPHMHKEEQVLFPYIEALEAAIISHTSVPQAFFGTVQNPVRMMSLEHDAVGDLLKAIRAASADFKVPEGACISYETLYTALQEFEADLHQHIHLENNILFPRAIEMERLAQSRKL